MKMPVLAKILVGYTLVVYPLLKLAGYSHQVASHLSGAVSADTLEYLSYLPKGFGLCAVVVSIVFLQSGTGRIRILLMAAFLLTSPLYNLIEPLLMFQLEPALAQDAEIVRRTFTSQAIWFVLSFGWSVAWLIYLLKSRSLQAWIGVVDKAQ